MFAYHLHDIPNMILYAVKDKVKASHYYGKYLE